MNPKYPVYIVSKNRAKEGTTRKAFDKLGVPYKIVIEKFDYENYKKEVGEDKLLILPQKYLDDYNPYDSLGNKKSKGPGAARNFCWDHSINNGHKRHWVFDDNVSAFYRLNRNRRLPVADGTIFRVMEIFCDRYKNIAQAGPNYLSYAPDRDGNLPPFLLNWRVYSMLLINNSIPYRWRGRYNEDTDLSLRALKDGWCTIQFNAFLGDKATTQTMKGGNTEDFYAKDGTWNKSKMLCVMHPDVCEMWKAYGRWHHKVNYKPYKKNKLIFKDGIKLESRVNNYKMKLIRV